MTIKQNGWRDEQIRKKTGLEPEDLPLLLIDGVELTDPKQFNVPDEDARNFIAANAGRRLSWSSVPTIESQLRVYAIYLQTERNTTIKQADLVDVASFLSHCAMQRENRIGTLRIKQSTLAGLYGFLEVTLDDLPSVTSQQIRDLRVNDLKPRVPETIQREALSREEIRKLLAQNLCPRDRLMILVCYQTAARNKDVRELRIDNIDLEKLIITIEYSKGNKTYPVPITDKLALEIEHFIDTGRKAYKDYNHHEYLFPSTRGGCLKSNERFTHIVSKAAEDAGIQKVLGRIKRNNGVSLKKYDNLHRVTPHALRHSILTHLKDENVSDEFRSKFAGHSNVQTTVEYYTHTGGSEILEKLRDATTAIEQQ